MNFCKASLLSFLTVFLLSTAKTAAATIRSKEDDNSPEGISWEIENENTGEIIASQEEGFYTEAEVTYTHNETICLDMDNSDVCYKVVVRDTSDYYYTSTETKLFHFTEDPVVDKYSKDTYGSEAYSVCEFSDFWYEYAGCFVSPSCECGDTAYCFFEPISLVFCDIFYALSVVVLIVCCPCIAVYYALAIFYIIYFQAL